MASEQIFPWPALTALRAVTRRLALARYTRRLSIATTISVVGVNDPIIASIVHHRSWFMRRTCNTESSRLSSGSASGLWAGQTHSTEKVPFSAPGVGAGVNRKLGLNFNDENVGVDVPPKITRALELSNVKGHPYCSQS